MGVVTIQDALSRAATSDLDLVMVSDSAKPPVCRLINYGQFRYQQQKKEKLARKSNKGQVVKELKMSPKISDHDFMVKLNRGRDFLAKGFNIKLVLSFKGREMMHPELGEVLIKRFIENISDIGVPEQGMSRTGRAMIVMINPK